MTLPSTLPSETPQSPYDEFRSALLSSGLLYVTGSEGVYGYSSTYQRIVDALNRRIHDLGSGKFDVLRFPPVLARSTFDQTGYLQAFPDLMGSVHVFRGGDRDHLELSRRYEDGDNWQDLLQPSDVVLSSAACHSVYPLCTGRLPSGGRYIEIENWCFRHEPSIDPARMVAFRMHELVYIGEPEVAETYRDSFLANGVRLLTDLGLPMSIVPANDPFFGRLGNILASTQLEENLKLEGVTPICSVERPTAIISGNCARDHFGAPFGIETDDGQVAHTSCVAFGVDRITLALLHRHGLDPVEWPKEIQRQLWE